MSKVTNFSTPLSRTLFAFQNSILRTPCQTWYPTYSHYTTLCET